MAASVVQVGTAVPTNGNQTRSVPITGVTGGNSIGIAGIIDGAVPNGTVFTATGYTQVNSSTVIVQGSRKNLVILVQHNAAGGSYNDTVDSGSGTAGLCFGTWVPFEMANIKQQDALVISSNTNSGFSAAPSLTSGTLPATNMLLISLMIIGQAVNPMNISTPSGYTSMVLNQNSTGGTTPGSIAYQVVATNAAQSISYGTAAGAENWGVALFGFEEAPVAGPGQWFQYQPRLNVLARR